MKTVTYEKGKGYSFAQANEVHYVPVKKKHRKNKEKIFTGFYTVSGKSLYMNCSIMNLERLALSSRKALHALQWLQKNIHNYNIVSLSTQGGSPMMFNN